MAGWADMILGSTNPFAQWADSNAYVRSAMGAGLASGQNFESGLSSAVQGIPQARQAQNAYDMSLKDQQTRLDQIEYERTLQQNALKLQADARQQAADWATKNGHGDVAPLLQSGALTGSDIYNSDNKMSFAPAGSVPYLGNKPAPGAGAGAASTFYGGDEKSRALDYLIRANQPGADPALKKTPDYQVSYAVATTPTMTPQGMMQMQIPPSWAPGQAEAAPAAPPPVTGNQDVPPPAVLAAPQASPAAAGGAAPFQPQVALPGGDSGMPMVAPPATVQSGPGIIPGTRPFNESQNRVTGLANMAIPDLATAITKYPALSNPKDQILQGISKYDPTGIAHGAQSDDYQRAYSATHSAISNILYTVSGAAIGDKEMERKIEDLTPQLGDHPPLVADKLNRLADYVSSIANASGDQATIAYAQKAIAGIKAAQAKIAAGSTQTAPPGDQTKVPAGKIIYGPGGKQYIMGADGIPKPVI